MVGLGWHQYTRGGQHVLPPTWREANDPPRPASVPQESRPGRPMTPLHVGAGPNTRPGESREGEWDMFTFVLFDNGREIENVGAGTYASEVEAQVAGEAALDDYCPRGSAHRSFYRAETVEA